ncbi:3-methyl-2-oxobutanoate hydroxymethyltransferase [Blastococcus saxobsidens]|uniref:3-methyl-2-oxobutanoate hydroxymethyltransferase n=1 Tax=Blastococcus saxobsidens TaxID=138336 RepID=A0A6L9W1T4_9ACTN|nr:3-methyl-2-oxobutanoate hydroxymethyltransferase [Blastococcus saxobsidens]NEK85953.1 3-methyl-2-oxobutanoate hydroxymethyltransferase [Blastococcus saxobsidens]
MAVETQTLSSCARAATAEEARYRIDRPIAPSRAGRVVALDPGAADVLRRTAQHGWANARFYVCEAGAGEGEDVVLRDVDGGPATLADELASASVVVMVATDDTGAACAHGLGKACWERGIQTAGLVLGDGTHAGTTASAAVAALRPHARVLLPSADEADVVDLLSALRV